MQVKKAYQLLCDPKQKEICISNIELVKKDVNKERRKLLGKGVRTFVVVNDSSSSDIWDCMDGRWSAVYMR